MHALQVALQVAGESETGDDQNDGEDGEEEAVDDDGQTTPVGLGGEAGCLVENTDSVVGRRRVAGAITDGDVGQGGRRTANLLVVVLIKVDQKNFRHKPVQ